MEAKIQWCRNCWDVGYVIVFIKHPVQYWCDNYLCAFFFYLSDVFFSSSCTVVLHRSCN